MSPDAGTPLTTGGCTVVARVVKPGSEGGKKRKGGKFEIGLCGREGEDPVVFAFPLLFLSCPSTYACSHSVSHSVQQLQAVSECQPEKDVSHSV
jgi:hypothetical protein